MATTQTTDETVSEAETDDHAGTNEPLPDHDPEWVDDQFYAAGRYDY